MAHIAMVARSRGASLLVAAKLKRKAVTLEALRKKSNMHVRYVQACMGEYATCSLA